MAACDGPNENHRMYCLEAETDDPMGRYRMENEVVLLGESGPCRVAMEEIGAMSASFNYETACRVSQRVPRLYIYRGAPAGFQSVLTTEQNFLAKRAGL